MQSLRPHNLNAECLAVSALFSAAELLRCLEMVWRDWQPCWPLLEAVKYTADMQVPAAALADTGGFSCWPGCSKVHT